MRDATTVPTLAAEPCDPPAAIAEQVGADAEVEPLVEADLLVEDVSIDGMCGVY